MMASALALFKEECEAAEIEYEINPKMHITIEELRQQSANADLILTDSQSPFYEGLLSHALSDTCPVLLLSSNARTIERIVFANDDGPSSMYAIRKLAEVFKTWRTKPLIVVHVISEHERDAGNQDEVRSYLAGRFETINVNLIRGEVKEALIDFIKPIGENTVCVLGSDKRSAIGRLLHNSVAMAIAENTTASVFIAHS